MADNDTRVGLFGFFRKRKNYQEIVRKYSEALARPMVDLDRFARLAPYLLEKTLSLSGACMLVLDRQNQKYLVRAGCGEAENLVGQTISQDAPLVKNLLARRREISGGTDLAVLKSVVAVPVISESSYFNQPTLLAIIALGRKPDGQSYNKEDLACLETIANQSAISIEYSFVMEELNKSQKLAAIGTTTAGIAHELKNPLTYLLTIADTMTDNWDNPEFKESVKKLFPSEVERMKLIIDGLSDFSKTHELRLAPSDLGIIIDRAIALLSFEARKNNIEIIRDYHGSRALADKDRIIQVFINLINNAIQAIGARGGQIRLSAGSEGKNVKLTIADNGPGMTAETIGKIFDPFFTTKESGTGLGLSITKKIIEEHNGKLEVSSLVGSGTTFTICLPRA